MSGKLRIVLVVLILAAASSISFLAPSLRQQSSTATTSDALALKNDRSDSDKDGLIDRDEIYWRTNILNPDTDGDGFMDGEEILTGHNPLIKGPNDYLDPKHNATQSITDLVVGGIAAGDLSPDSPNYKESVRMIAEAMATQYGRSTTIPKDALSVVEDGDTAKTTYVRAMSAAFLKLIIPATEDTNAFFSTFRSVPIASPSWTSTNPKLYAAFSKEAHKLAGVMQSRAEKVVAIPVPSSFEPQHIGAVQFLRTQQRYYELLAQYKDDPMLGSAALSGLLRLQYDGFQSLMYDFTTALSIKLQ